MDETFIGGLSRKKHKVARTRKTQGTDGRDKTFAVGFLERGGKIRTSIPGNRRKKTLHREFRGNVSMGSKPSTDAVPSYDDPAEDATRLLIDF